ncbi:MAG: exonuclease SbcCD subunit D [Lachnospiraceae bacterium]|nr:exonuclease SbcCD subunit D [Lachnospiraceae bacterium]
MKFLHTSDWHLGMPLPGGRSYAADQRYAIDKICRIATDEQVDGILLSGDVFDKSIASSEAIQIYDEVITYICTDLKIPVYMIAGNHDGAERLSQLSCLLENSGLYISGSFTGDIRPVSAGDTDIYLLPWISTDKVKSLYPEEADGIGSLNDAYMLVLSKFREHLNKNHTNILVAHAFITNAQTSTSDRSAEVGKAAMIDSSVFEGFDYVALGHLHGPQDVTAPKSTDTSTCTKIRYSGSPVIYSFGREESQVKSVTIIDTAGMDIKTVPIPQLHKRVTLTGTFDELKNGAFDDETLDAYVHLNVTDSYVGLEAMAAFRDKFKNLLEITGKSFEKEDAAITMTVEEFEEESSDPEAIFDRYCKDIMQEAPDEHLKGLFKAALDRYSREVSGE